MFLRIVEKVEGVNWDMEDYGGMTPVDCALRNGHRGIAKLLCDYYGRSVPGTLAPSVSSNSSPEDDFGVRGCVGFGASHKKVFLDHPKRLILCLIHRYPILV